MLQLTASGLHCAAGGFHVDPWRPVDRALITHAHSDHARAGSRSYLCAAPGEGVLRLRLGRAAPIQGVAYGEVLDLGGVRVSFHPAGHVLGSAQIRLEHRGEVWVVSGDYKLGPDPTCAPFEPVRCHTFITESTFGLPIYRWPDPAQVFAALHAWWRGNQQEQRTSLVFGYSLGKAQRLLAGLHPDVGPVLAHPAVREFLPAYAQAGIALPDVPEATPERVRAAGGRAMVIAPPMTADSAWMESLGEVSAAFASGWMLIRGFRRRQNTDRGWVLSDHADWPGLLSAIEATGAERVLVTHGASAALVRWLREHGRAADPLATPFAPESEEAT